jgi:small subunit ribosomal protein S20
MEKPFYQNAPFYNTVLYEFSINRYHCPQSKRKEAFMADEKGAAPAGKKKVEARQTSAQKRNLQSEKRRVKNRSYRATVLTAVRSLDKAIQEKATPELIRTQLHTIYGLVDRGVKKGIYKTNKAARTKSRLSSKISSL